MVYDDWLYNKSHVITSASTLTDYQVKLTVYYGSGTDSGSSVYLNSHCNVDFSDIRFTNSSGAALPYWIESYTSGVSAVVWVKIDSITTSTTIYVYYGNGSAVSESNGDSVFEFFDDFEGSTLSKWTGDTTYGTISNGILSYMYNTTSETWKYIFSNVTLSTSTIPYAIRTRCSIVASTPWALYQMCGFQLSDTIGTGRAILTSIGSYPLTVLTESQGFGAANIYTTGYKIFEIQYNPSVNTKFYVDGSLVVTHTCNSPANTKVSIGSCNGGTHTNDWIVVRKYAATEPTHSTWGTETFNIDVYIASETIALTDIPCGEVDTGSAFEIITISDTATRLLHTRILHEIITVSDSIINPIIYLAQEVIELIDTTIRGYVVTELIKVFNGNDMDRAAVDEYGGSCGKRLDEYGNLIGGKIKATGQMIVRALHYRTNTNCQVIEDVAICSELIKVSSNGDEQE